jgi:hypothetical protein
MSRPPTSPSHDLNRLRDEGYEIEVRQGYLLVHNVPYVDEQRAVRRGVLVSALTMAGDVTARPQDHVAQFTGDAPCDENGRVMSEIMAGSGRAELLPGLIVQHTFSSKPAAGYADYFEKMSTYVGILSGPAQAIDPAATAVTFGVVEQIDPESVFNYMETASSRAQISVATAKLREHKIAIVGLGGTGAYVLDLVAKTPVAEIHLFDGDTFLQHNAFRSPGAISVEELRQLPSKVSYYERRYAPMRRKIFAHEVYVEESNVGELDGMEFVFLCLDSGPARRLIVERLEQRGVPFVDVGMGVFDSTGSLGGQIRVTTSTNEQRRHVWEKERISFGDDDPANQYRQNIQIADLNALNAALAVIRWKKLVGFYVDLEREHNSVYIIDGNELVNEDAP